MERRAQVGVFGGSGFYELLEGVERVELETPYGPPSGALALGEVGGVPVAFLPRHGQGHRFPPHAINYRANLWAMAALGVERILAPSAAGSLQPHVKPGDFVVCDQYVDRTSGRTSTFFDGPTTVHIAQAEPYCPHLRELAVDAARELGITIHERGTVVVVQGPRFSTRAESRWFSSMGWEVVNMTQYPEVALARELQLCYVNISLITDWDVGLEGQPEVRPVSVEEVLRVLKANNDRVRDLIFALVPRLAGERRCPCAPALADATL
ncbi:MAG: S-methyl-5'-thioadenosine phosphorylase [Chloroflexi bacterium]|nr:S-methyl-5'-thioadenosine phosphorylase [Chloroflexota bacterium]